MRVIVQAVGTVMVTEVMYTMRAEGADRTMRFARVVETSRILDTVAVRVGSARRRMEIERIKCSTRTIRSVRTGAGMGAVEAVWISPTMWTA